MILQRNKSSFTIPIYNIAINNIREYYRMKIDLPDFFILPNELSSLNSCEEKLIRGFGHNKANFSQMGYISRGKIKVEFSTTNSGQSIATFNSEKYIKSLIVKIFI